MGEITVIIMVSGPPENWDESANKIMMELREKGFQYYTHPIGTNTVNLPLNDNSEISNAVHKIGELADKPYFHIWSDPESQLVDAIENHEYFKAFALCTRYYEFLGKSILINYFKINDLTVSKKDTVERLGLGDVLLMLYTYKLIKYERYLQMKTIERIRNTFIHREPVGQIPKDLYDDVSNNIHIVFGTLYDLDQINKEKQKELDKKIDI